MDLDKQQGHCRVGADCAPSSLVLTHPVDHGRGEAVVFCAGLALLAMAFLAYFAIAILSTSDQHRLVLDYIDGFRLFGVDDAYRYFLARCVGIQSGMWAWNYDLPLALLPDSVIVHLSHGSLQAARCLRILPAFLCLWLIYATGLRLGIRKSFVACGVALLACMPMYCLTFLGFLGEGWLLLLVALCGFCLAGGQYYRGTILLALAPMMRPEGLYLMVPYGVFLLKQRRWRELVVLLLPGVIYFLFILAQPGGLASFIQWRYQLRMEINILRASWLYRPLGEFSTFNALWLITSIAGLFLPRLRPLWPVWSGGLLVGGIFSMLVAVGLTYYESRYFMLLMPVLALAWANIFQVLSDGFLISEKRALPVLFLLCTGLVMAEHMLQSDPLKARYGAGRRWPLADVSPSIVTYSEYSQDALMAGKKMADALYETLAQKSAVDTVVIADYRSFYDIDPERILHRATIVFAPISFYEAIKYFDGSFYVMFPGGKQFAYYNFRKSWPGSRSTALYVGQLPFSYQECHACTPVYDRLGRQIYNFEYTVSENPQRSPAQEEWEEVPRSVELL